MKDTWDKKAKTWIIYIEGGLVRDKDDPGGETKYGISKRAYPNLDIASLTEDDALRIYKRDYWDKCDCDNLPYGMDLEVFDCAVNMGPNASMALMNNAPTYEDHILNRIERYINISAKNANLKKFFRGWVIRCIKLRHVVEG